MKVKKYTNKIFYLLAFLLLLSCGGPNIKRGSLSEVVQKSNDNYKEKREIKRTVVSENTSEWCFFCDNTVSIKHKPPSYDYTVSNTVEPTLYDKMFSNKPKSVIYDSSVSNKPKPKRGSI